MTHPDAHGDSSWLERLSAEEWLRAGVAELSRAERALARHERERAVAGLKRAAGMALNGALRVVADPSFGRTYVEHLEALTRSPRAKAEVREAAALLYALDPRPGTTVTLATPKVHEAWLEAARTVMAHAYAVVHGSVAGRSSSP